MTPANVWAYYVAELIGDESQSQAARRSGVPQGTISRWMSGTYVPDKPAPVAMFAQAYHRNVLEAFVAAGFLEVADVNPALDDDARQMLRRLGVRVPRPPKPPPARRTSA